MTTRHLRNITKNHNNRVRYDRLTERAANPYWTWTPEDPIAPYVKEQLEWAIREWAQNEYGVSGTKEFKCSNCGTYGVYRTDMNHRCFTCGEEIWVDAS